MEEINEICQQCKREVPKSNMTIHLLRCVQNVQCSVCDETVPAKLIGQHMRLTHNKLVPCPDCQTEVLQKDLNVHRSTECTERKVQCEYCEIELREPDMEEHLLYCGTRTERCLECNEYVMFKYKQLHLESNHTFLKLDDEPGPTASWNQKKDAFDDVYENNSPQFFLPGASVSKKYVDGGSDFVFLDESNHRNENIFQRSQSSADEIAERAATSIRAITSALENLRANDIRSERNRNASGATSSRDIRSEFNPNTALYNTLSRFNGPVNPPTGALKKNHQNISQRNQSSKDQMAGRVVASSIIPKISSGAKKLGSNDFRIEQNRNLFGTTRSEVRPSTSISEFSKRNKGARPPTQTKVEDILIPCDICGTQIPSANFHKHEISCQQKMLAEFPDEEPKRKGLQFRETNGGIAREIQLPCEFCCDMFLISQLLTHQKQCELKE